MTTVKDVLTALFELAKPEYAMEWDNVGLLLGEMNRPVETICVALDVTDDTIAFALQAEADLIVAHHPLIFSAVKKINDTDMTGRRLLALAGAHCACIAMHTNYDVSIMGDLAAGRLGLLEPEVLWQTAVSSDGTAAMGIGAFGRMPKTMNLQSCAELVAERFGLPNVRIFGDPQLPVTRAAVSPGSGKHMYPYAAAAGCDVLITGDIDHHEGLDAIGNGIAVIDAGHYGIEHIFIDHVTGWLKDRFESVQVLPVPSGQPFTVIEAATHSD